MTRHCHVKEERVAQANASTNVARAALEINESTAGVRKICKIFDQPAKEIE